MGLLDMVGNIFTGGLADSKGPLGLESILGGGGGGNGGNVAPDNNSGMIAMANASTEAAKAQSNAQVQIAQTQAVTERMGILQSSQQAQFQTLAWLTDRLDANDTKMQIAVENAKIAFQQESDRHVEHMEGLKNDARELEIRAVDEAKDRGSVSTADFLA
jgi:hypothetical protein